VNRGAEVTLVCGPTSEIVPSGLSLIKVNTAAEMYEACMQNFKDADMAIMSAAVADYTIANPSSQKIKKASDSLILELTKSKDILKSLGGIKRDNQLLVGFALETADEKENALKKMKDKNADVIILNSLNDQGAGFGHNTNKISIFDNEGNQSEFGLKSKAEVASDIINYLVKLLHA
jgi:phosphopantothenoylcysteine decarboxylase/phosphopantothenate--cysteine ligase